MPGKLAVTLTAMVQVVAGGMVPPLKVRRVAPADGANVDAPPQFPLFAGLGVPATCTPVGSASDSEKFVNEVSAGAVMLMNSLEMPFSGMVSGLKSLLPPTPKPVAYTLIFAFAGRILVAPSVVCRAPDGMLFV